MLSTVRTPDPLSYDLPPTPPTLSYTQGSSSSQHPYGSTASYAAPSLVAGQPPPAEPSASRFSTRRFPTQPFGGGGGSSNVSAAPHLDADARHDGTNESSSKLAKKGSRPFLGWFARKLRKSMGAGTAADAGRPSPLGTLQPPRSAHALRRSSRGGGGALMGGELTEDGAGAAQPTASSSGQQSDYGRLVANNGLSYLHAGSSSGERGRDNMSHVSEGDRGSSASRGADNGEEDEGDYQSVATSLDPFPPSHHRLSTRHQSISSSRWTPSSFTASSSSSTLDDYSTMASASIQHRPLSQHTSSPWPHRTPSSTRPYRSRQGSEAHPDYHSRDHTPDAASAVETEATDGQSAMHYDADDNASLRPIPPSIPPSPSPSHPSAHTVAPSFTSSSLRSQSYAASLAPSSRGWRSIATAATPTTAETSVDSASTSTGGAESIFIHGPMAHIAQVPVAQADEQPGAGPSTGPAPAHQQLRTHARRSSSASGTMLEPSVPYLSSPLASHAAGSSNNGSTPAVGRPRAPSSPTAPSSASATRWGTPASPPPLVRPATSAGSRDAAWQQTVRPQSLLSHALATAALASPAQHNRADSASLHGAQGGLEPPAVIIPLQQLGSSLSTSPLPHHHSFAGVSPTAAHFDPLSHIPSSPLHASHLYAPAPTHSAYHPRNNPAPLAAPNDNASLLTLASSSFFAFPTAAPGSVTNGSVLTNPNGSIFNGNPGRSGSSVMNVSIRRGVERSESVSFSFTGTGGGVGGIGAGGYGTAPSAVGRRYDDPASSVRAVRRKGSWESGESRWSAAAVAIGGGGNVAPSSASILGQQRYYPRGGGGGGHAGDRDSIAGLWGGPSWASVAGGRQGSILAGDGVDEQPENSDGAHSVSFSFRSGDARRHLDEHDNDDDGENEDEDGGNSRLNHRRGRRSSSVHSRRSSTSSRSSSRSRFATSSDDDDVLPAVATIDVPPIILPMDSAYSRRDSGGLEGSIEGFDGANVGSDERESATEEEEACTPGPVEAFQRPLGTSFKGS